MKYIFWFLLAILLNGCINNSENAEVNSQIDVLRTKRDSLVQLNSQLEAKADSLKRERDSWFDNNTEGKYLLEMGVEDPKVFIVNSLKQQPEIVPAEPVLGGKMRFTRVQLLGEDCLIAYYEDGHIAGRAIYSFEYIDGDLVFSLIRRCSN